MMNSKFIIYQLFPRLFTNTCEKCTPNGSIETNGVGKMNDISERVLESLKELGVTHVWYTGIIEHATKTDYSAFGIMRDNPLVVKGNAGSPYAIKDYYDVDPDVAVDVRNRMAEFSSLVNRTHSTGLKVIIDFVPNHVARQYHSDAKPNGVEDLGASDDTTYFFKSTNNFYYIPRQKFSPHINFENEGGSYYEFPAKATGNDCFNAFPSANDWYETVKLNYGVDYGDHTCHFDPIPDTWFKMLNILRFWASKGVDGFRCDMAFMVPIEFWNWAIPQVKEKYPEIIFIAELYDVNIYRDYIEKGGFDYLYDKVNLYDTLRAIQCNDVSAARLTSCWQTIDGISDKMLNFLENHDEQRFASRFYAGSVAYTLPSLVVSATLTKAPFMLYQGQELGEAAIDAEGFSGYDGRTTIFDYWSIPSLRRWYNSGRCDGAESSVREKETRELYKKLLNIAVNEDAICKGKMFDLMYVNYENPTFDPHRLFAYIRACGDEFIFIVVNFGSNPAAPCINIPLHAFEYLGMPQGEYDATELMSNESRKFLIQSTSGINVEIPAYGAVMWKMRKKENCETLKKSSFKSASTKLK